jgi:hypothetical protein
VAKLWDEHDDGRGDSHRKTAGAIQAHMCENRFEIWEGCKEELRAAVYIGMRCCCANAQVKPPATLPTNMSPTNSLKTKENHRSSGDKISSKRKAPSRPYLRTMRLSSKSWISRSYQDVSTEGTTRSLRLQTRRTR